ncbi:hypothetical protein F4804DRAFT_197722 [Jackrogersella minutella]|nr:hypothetical protein F4804DRAFT_197722 [Jackrogersella minutella]
MSRYTSSSSPSTAGSTAYTDSTGYSYAQSTTTNHTVSDNGFDNMADPEPGSYLLPCEFVGLGSCNRTFPYNDTDAWVEHIVTEHLCGRLPREADCWYCDAYHFDARHPQVQNDRRQNFYNRMEHIRTHIADGMNANGIRPDYYMAKHLHDHKLIPESTYRAVMIYNELPCSPDQLRHIRDRDFMPPERRIQQERSIMVPIDHGKEERQRRKKNKNRK